MAPIPALHLVTGSLAILAGTAASVCRKGSALHRASGNLFSVAMLVMSALGILLALSTPGLR